VSRAPGRDALTSASYRAMLTRCSSPRTNGYENYGGRGICVCDRWLNSYDNFLADLGPRPSKQHSLDRRDVNGNYTPENCRWATKEEQYWNTRVSLMLTCRGETKSLPQWLAELGCADVGLGYGIVAQRLRRGWPIEAALTQPSGTRNPTPRARATFIRPKPPCEWCQGPKSERVVLEDCEVRLCRKCHMVADGRYDRFVEMAKRPKPWLAARNRRAA
jgi:hypothetical protein